MVVALSSLTKVAMLIDPSGAAARFLASTPAHSSASRWAGGMPAINNAAESKTVL